MSAVLSAGVLTAVLASGSSDDSTGLALALFAAGPASGFAVWWYIHNKYRNKNARYMPESVVHHQVHNLTTDDAYIKRIQTSASKVKGRNDHQPHVRAKYVNATVVEPPPPEETPEELLEAQLEQQLAAQPEQQVEGESPEGR